MLGAPALLAQFARQPVEQRLVCRRRAAQSEIARRLDEAAAKVLLPDEIHPDPRGERIGVRHEPVHQLRTRSQIGSASIEHGRQSRRHAFGRGMGIAAAKHQRDVGLQCVRLVGKRVLTARRQILDLMPAGGWRVITPRVRLAFEQRLLLRLDLFAQRLDQLAVVLAQCGLELLVGGNRSRGFFCIHSGWALLDLLSRGVQELFQQGARGGEFRRARLLPFLEQPRIAQHEVVDLAAYEKTMQGVISAGGERLEFVVVALSALQRQAERD